MALKTVHLESFHSIPLCCTPNLSKNITWTGRKLDKKCKSWQTFRTQNIGHASLPILNGSASPPPSGSIYNMPYRLCEKFHNFGVPNNRHMADCFFLHHEMINYDVTNSIDFHVLCWHWRKRYFLFSLGNLNLELHISRMAWRISVIHISFFSIFTNKALLNKSNLCLPCSSPPSGPAFLVVRQARGGGRGELRWLRSTDWSKLYKSHYSHKSIPDAKCEAGSSSSFGDIMSQHFLWKKGKSHQIPLFTPVKRV